MSRDGIVPLVILTSCCRGISAGHRPVPGVGGLSAYRNPLGLTAACLVKFPTNEAVNWKAGILVDGSNNPCRALTLPQKLQLTPRFLRNDSSGAAKVGLLSLVPLSCFYHIVPPLLISRPETILVLESL